MKYKGYQIDLVDDGSLDTVIKVDGSESRFSGQYVAHYRNKNGVLTKEDFLELADEAIEEYEDNMFMESNSI